MLRKLSANVIAELPFGEGKPMLQDGIGRHILGGWLTMDMSLQRRIDVTGRVNATLRWDIFNLLNRANLGLPDGNIVNATAGVISNLSGDPRVMQLSVRIGF